MNVQDEYDLISRCEESLGTSKKAIYEQCWLALSFHTSFVKSALDMAAGRGNFKKFVAPKVDFKIDECDFCFGGREDFYQIDLNKTFDLQKTYDLITLQEALQYFENPRHVLRQAVKHLNNPGLLMISTPNLHSLTSTLSFILRGCHSQFVGKNYPSQITPVHKIDLDRMVTELGLRIVAEGTVHEGRMPGLNYKWQDLPIIGHFFTHSLFCDNIYVITRKEFDGSHS